MSFCVRSDAHRKLLFLPLHTARRGVTGQTEQCFSFILLSVCVVFLSASSLITSTTSQMKCLNGWRRADRPHSLHHSHWYPPDLRRTSSSGRMILPQHLSHSPPSLSWVYRSLLHILSSSLISTVWPPPLSSSSIKFSIWNIRGNFPLWPKGYFFIYDANSSGISLLVQWSWVWNWRREVIVDIRHGEPLQIIKKDKNGRVLKRYRISIVDEMLMA